MILNFIKDNWILVAAVVGALITIIAVPPIRKVMFKALQTALLKLGQAFMAMLTAELLIRGLLWVLKRVAEKTKGTLDDKLVVLLEKEIEKNK